MCARLTLQLHCPPVYRAPCDGYAAVMKKETSTGKCASKCEFTGNKSQPETMAEDCPAGLPRLRALFPRCFRAERGAEDLPCSCFALGLVFQVKDLPHCQVLPDEAVGSLSRLVTNTHYKLPVSLGYWKCSAQTPFQDIDNSCCKVSVRSGYLF